MGFSAVIYDIGGANKINLDSCGLISALTYSSVYPGGDQTMTLSLDRPLFETPLLKLGRQITIYDCLSPVFTGILADPVRGAPWTLTAQGLSTLAPRYLALDLTLSPNNVTIVGNTALDQAISRGLPWTRSGSITQPTGWNNLTVMPDKTLDTLLTSIAQANGQNWTVDETGTFTMTAPPTTNMWVLNATNVPGGRTTDDWASDLYAYYSSSTITGNPDVIQAASNNPSGANPTPFGRWERIDDITAWGPLPASVANTAANNDLKLVGPDPSFTGTIQVAAGDMWTAAGGPARLASVRAGDLVKVIGIAPDPVMGQIAPGVTNLIIGEWDYDAIADTATMTPFGAVKRDITSVLTKVLAATSTN